jgi:hypothetical protein
MREKVIIFDGEKDQLIGAPYFFQDERIRDLNKDQVLELYKQTRIKHYTVVLFSDRDPGYVYQISRGLNILKQMVLDMWGDDIGALHINQIETNLKMVS